MSAGTGIEQLVITRLNEGAHYRSLTARAVAAGEYVKYQTWQDLRYGTIREFPAVKTIRGIAAALDESHATVVLALAKTLGLDVGPLLLALLPTPRVDDEQVAAR